MKHFVWLVLAATCLAWRPAAAASTSICDIEVVTSLNHQLYAVTVNGEAFKGKKYLHYTDAVGLRDVLLSTGECVRPKQMRACDVLKTSAGGYTVTRAGNIYDVKMSFGSEKAARKHARKLQRKHICLVQ